VQKIKVLHLFNQYLPQTENWSYKLIKNTPEVEVFIGAKVYLKNDFYDPHFTIAKHPLSDLAHANSRLDKKYFFQAAQKIWIKGLKFMLGTPQKYILKFAQQKEVDIVHAHFADVAWAFKSIPEDLKKPFVISFYGWDYEQLPTIQPAYQKHYQELFRKATLIVCEGKHGAQILEKMACPPEKLKVIPLGVEPQNIPFHQRDKKTEELHLLQLATFNEKKGHIYTVRAFAKALDLCPNMTLTLIGGAGTKGIKKEVVEFIEANALGNKVKILDHLDYSQLYTCLKDFQVFIHPSCYSKDRDCEGGAPIVILDAQATGMPVISTQHCDIPGEVKDGQTGLLAPEKDIDQLAKHIERFYKMDKEAYDVFSKEARKHVCKHFDSRQNATQMRALYAALLK